MVIPSLVAGLWSFRVWLLCCGHSEFDCCAVVIPSLIAVMWPLRVWLLCCGHSKFQCCGSGSVINCTDLDPSTNKQKTLSSLLFCDLLLTFVFEDWCKKTIKKYNKQNITYFLLAFRQPLTKLTGFGPGSVSHWYGSVPNCHGSTERKWAFPGAGPGAPWAPHPACWAPPAEPPAPAPAQPPHCPRPGHTRTQFITGSVRN